MTTRTDIERPRGDPGASVYGVAVSTQRWHGVATSASRGGGAVQAGRLSLGDHREPLEVSYVSGGKLSIPAASGSAVRYGMIKAHFKASHGGSSMPLAAKDALRSNPTRTIDSVSVQRMLDVLGDEQGLDPANHILHPKQDALVNDANYVKDSKLEVGKGKFNRLVQRTFRTAKTSSAAAFLGITAKKARVVKEAKDVQYEGGSTTQTRGTGIDARFPRMPDRNVATSIVDRLLGTRCVPKSSAGILKGKACVAMSVAPGTTAKKAYIAHPALIVHPDFQRQMTDVEVNAFLSGNPDPHMENMMVDVKTKKGTGEIIGVKVTMIDNDTCHGPAFSNPDRPEIFPGVLIPQYRHTGLPAYIDAETARKALRMDPDLCSAKLSKNLNPEEIAAFKSRLSLLKAHVAFLQKEGRVVSDWVAFTDGDGNKCRGGNYIGGSLMMPGIQHGVTDDGQPRITPRSLILRDIKETKLGLHFKMRPAQGDNPFVKTEAAENRKLCDDFSDHLGSVTGSRASGRALYQNIVGEAAVDVGLMPPSGDPDLLSHFHFRENSVDPAGVDDDEAEEATASAFDLGGAAPACGPRSVGAGGPVGVAVAGSPRCGRRSDVWQPQPLPAGRRPRALRGCGTGDAARTGRAGHRRRASWGRGRGTSDAARTGRAGRRRARIRADAPLGRKPGAADGRFASGFHHTSPVGAGSADGGSIRRHQRAGPRESCIRRSDPERSGGLRPLPPRLAGTAIGVPEGGDAVISTDRGRKLPASAAKACQPHRAVPGPRTATAEPRSRKRRRGRPGPSRPKA